MAEPMSCSDVRARLGADLDGELLTPEASAVANHLATCEGCHRERAALVTLRAAIRQHLPPRAAGDLLRARVSASIRGEGSGNAPRRTRRATWTRQVAAGLAVALASSGTTWALLQKSSTDTTVAVSDVVGSHIRSLMASHLTDITSTDEHNVKPWFDGKVPFAPEVPRLDSAGYPLIGGRVDTVDHTPVAALVYGRRKHLINLFTWPTRAGAGGGDTVSGATERGYNVVRWSRGDMLYAAVSDLAMTDLREFVVAYSSLPSLIPSKSTVDR